MAPRHRHRPGTMVRAALALLFLGNVAEAQPRELRFATLLPSGSAWMKELRRLAARVAQRSRGQLRLRFFADAVMGDERDVVAKMDRDQLHGAAVTTVGLGLLVPQVRVLELPMLLRSTEELDAIREALAGEFGAAFQRRGYQLLGWGDLGWIRLFSVRRVRSLADLKRMRIWSWTDDPVARTLVKRFGVRGVPLGVQDVLPALETGLLDGAYGSPYVMLALQWHTKIRFIWRDNITYAMGALVMRHKTFQSLPPRLRQALEEESRFAAGQLVRQSREDNRRALARLRELGIEELPTPPEIRARLQEIARPLWQELSGSLYPRPLLDKVLRLLAERRTR